MRSMRGVGDMFESVIHPRGHANSTSTRFKCGIYLSIGENSRLLDHGDDGCFK